MLAVLAGGATGGASCRESDTPTSPVASVALSDTLVALRLGDEAVLVARARQVGGDDLEGRRIFWSSRDPQVAEVSQAGVVRAVSVGTTQVAANVEGQSAIATVRVLARPIATVQIEPAAVQLTVNARQRLAVRTLNDAGAPAAAAVTWTSLAPEVVSVSADGEVVALRPGVGLVRAAAEDVSATVAVAVTPVPVARVTIAPASPSVLVGATVPLTATTVDAGGNALPGRAVVWSSRNPGVAVVSSTGQVTGIAPGSAVIEATAEGQTATVPVAVRAAPVARVTLSPGATSVGVGGTVRLGAALADAAGNALTGRAVTYTSSAPGVATVAADGTVTGVAAGTATITAASEGVSGTATVTVVAAATPTAVASVAVTPPAATLVAGQTATLVATPRAADGSPVAGRAVTWSTTAAGVATVSPSGVVTAVGPGSAQILARVDGITGTAVVTVTPVPVAAVQLTPDAATLAAGSTVQLAATPRAAGGGALTGRSIEWRTDNASVASVTSDGLVRGESPGTTTVRATSEGVTGTATVTVTAVLRVTPTTATLTDRGNGSSRTAQLVATDHTGRILGETEVEWSSSNTSVASVSPTGLVRGQSAGGGSATATITATSRRDRAVSASATITVRRE